MDYVLYRFDRCEYRTDFRRLYNKEKRVILTPIEHKVFDLLCNHNKVSLDNIMDKIYNFENEPSSDALTTTIHRLRKKVREFSLDIICEKANPNKFKPRMYWLDKFYND